MKKFLLSIAAVAVAFGASAQSYALAGAFNDWNNSANEFTEVDGVLTLTVDKLPAGFKVVASGSWDPQWGAAQGAELTVGEAFSLLSKADNGGKDPGNIMYANGVTAVNNATVVFDPAAQTLTITGETEAVLPDYLYFPGGWSAGWNLNEDTKMAGKDGVYTITADFDGAFEFKVCGEGWSPEYGFPAVAEGEDPIAPFSDENAEGVLAGTTNAKADFTGTYTVTFTLATKAIKFEKTSGINTIATDNNVAPVYYNLQGVRVNEPANGLFIVVRGNEVSKVLVR